MERYIKVLRLIRYRRKKIFGKIGKNNFFADGTYIDDNADVGNYNYFGSRCMVLFAKIGNYCSIATNVIIAPANPYIAPCKIKGIFIYQLLTPISRIISISSFLD